VVKEESSALEMMMESQPQYPGAWVFFFQVVILEATVHFQKFQYLLESCGI